MKKSGSEPAIVQELRKAFALNNGRTRSKMYDLINKYPQLKNNKLRYLIVGSWGIEFLTGKKMLHSDIDLIILAKPARYLDSAKTKAEKCDGIIPLETMYFKRNNVGCNTTNKAKKTYVPDINTQLCFKFIGELRLALSKKAIQQLKYLSEYTINNPGIEKNKLTKILKECTPKRLNHKEIAEEIMIMLKSYKDKHYDEWLEQAKNIHETINSELRKAFDDHSII